MAFAACSSSSSATAVYTSSVNAVLAEHFGDHFDRHAGGAQHRGGAVPEIMEANWRQGRGDRDQDGGRWDSVLACDPVNGAAFPEEALPDHRVALREHVEPGGDVSGRKARPSSRDCLLKCAVIVFTAAPGQVAAATSAASPLSGRHAAPARNPSRTGSSLRWHRQPGCDR
jgi:hypothetical protein